MTVISVRELSKRYGSTLAIDSLSFDVLPGRVTGFLGPNGAGKSTTMRVILGLDRPDRGQATVGGCPYRQLRWPAYQVGAVLDPAAIYGGRRAGDHLLSVALSNGIPAARVTEVLEVTGLATAARRRAGGFSLGMKQRLGIAAALLGDPAIMLFDEPLNGLDPDGIVWIRGLLKSLAAEGRTVLVSSHLMSEMAITVDHVIVIGRGRLIADEGIAEFTHRAGMRQVRVSSPEAARLASLLTAHGARAEPAGDGALIVTGLDRPQIADLAAADGLPVHELVSQDASLEDAYLKLTSGVTDYRSGHPVQGSQS